MKHLLSSLLVITAALTTTSIASLAHAEQARVIKVKGQQAIVQFPNGVAPVVGEMIPVGGDAQTETGIRTARGSRAHILALLGSIYYRNNASTSTSRTGFSLQGRYGWNQEIFEFGPLGGFDYYSEPGLSNREITAGAFFDFNFIPNRPGTEMVYGVGAFGSGGQKSTVNGNLESTATIYNVFVGGNVKYFGLSDNVALRADAGFAFARSNETLATSPTTNTGILIQAGLGFYF